MSYGEYVEQARKLRNDAIVRAWIAAYQTDKWSTHADCTHCGFPHSPHLLCGRGASFGALRLGTDAYSVDLSNIVFFHQFMLELGQGWGFHWKCERFFKREDNGDVTVRFIEQFNNNPQVRAWSIPKAEWSSIVRATTDVANPTDR